MKKNTILFFAAILFLLTGCASRGQVMDGDGMLNSYKQISQEQAKEMK